MANAYRKKGDFAKAIPLYESLWQETADPFDGTGLLCCYRKSRLFGKAIPLAEELCKKNIEDSPDNTTRFLIIGKQEVQQTGDDKTTLLISARNKPGALYSLLQPLAKNNVSMTRIESRPSHCVNWEYVFFLDLEGHIQNETLQKALKDLEVEADLFKVLGSYPRAAL